MLEPLDIVNHLQDQDFDSVELVSLLGQFRREQREDAANIAVAQFNETQRRFIDRRNRRFDREFHAVLDDITEARKQVKWERSQEQYRKTRKEKKKQYWKENRERVLAERKRRDDLATQQKGS